MLVEVLALWKKGRRPKFKSPPEPEVGVVKSTAILDLSGHTCIHVNFKHEVCGEKVDDGRPHGWLCVHHDVTTRERERVAA